MTAAAAATAPRAAKTPDTTKIALIFYHGTHGLFKIATDREPHRDTVFIRNLDSR